MNKFTDFHDAYHFLSEHHYFEHGKWKEPHFEESLSIMVVKVNPETKAIDDDESKNTLTNVWLECGNWEDIPDHGWSGYVHDMELDCGGDTFEEAIINLANLVLEHYGENPDGYGELTEEQINEINSRWDKMLESAEEVNE
jgi:hypothetical protein